MGRHSEIHYYIHGRGRGHASRSRHAVQALRAAGHVVRVFAGEDARALFDGDCTAIRSIPVGVDAQLPGLVRERVASAIEAAGEGQASVLISDGDLPAVLAAKRLRLPSIAVGHGLVFARCKRPHGVPRMPWLREASKALTASAFATHHIAVNFVDLPARDPSTTTLARPELDGGNRRDKPADGPVVCYFRDEDGEPIARAVAESGAPVILFGQATGDAPGVSYSAISREAFEAAVQGARCVISSAGSQLMSECLLRGIPQLALHADGDDEQLLNVHMLNLLSGPSRGLARAACDAAAVRRFLHTIREPMTSHSAWPPKPVSQAVLDVTSRLLSS